MESCEVTRDDGMGTQEGQEWLRRITIMPFGKREAAVRVHFIECCSIYTGQGRRPATAKQSPKPTHPGFLLEGDKD